VAVVGTATRGGRQATVAVQSTFADRAAQHVRLVQAFDADLDRWRQTAGTHEAEAMRLSAEERAIYERRIAVEGSRRVFGRFLDMIGLGEATRLLGRERRLGRLRDDASARQARARWEYDRRLAGREPYLAPMAERERADRERVAEAERAEADLARD